MTKTPIALQLYSLREDTKQDFAATVSAVAAMGYVGVELAGYGNLDAAQARDALKSAGLVVSGMHVSREGLRDELPRIVAEALLLGTSHVICPWWPAEEFTSADACARIGEELNQYGAKLRQAGLLFSFHNHRSEFRVIDGRPVIEWILGAAEPRNLGLELDVYWAHVADFAPERFHREQGRRVRLLHLKDEKVLGEGPVDFAPVFATAEQIGGVDWYVVEQENYDDTPLASVKKCFEQMRAWGKA